MTFDIQRSLTNKHGEIDEEAVMKFEAEIMERFAASPEAGPIIERAGSVGWASSVMEYGRSYEGVTVTTMTRRTLKIVLLDVFPRKVSCEPSAALEIVEELRAFFSFVRRAFGLTNADECLALLDGDMVKTMRRELANPENFGMAKSFVMAGMKAGFDMTRQEDMDAFMLAYNARLLAVGAGPALPPLRPRPPAQAAKNKKKVQRRAQRASRRKSR
jgi:hypothetical protein